MTRATATVLGAAGAVLTAAGVTAELTDAEPRAQLWLGAAAGLVFLAAVLLVRGGEADALAGRARLLVGAGVGAVLAVFGLWRTTEHTEPRILLLLAPVLLLFGTAAITVREAGRSRSAVAATRLRSRLEGQESERRRWARELHDQTLQDLAAVEVRLGGLAAAGDPAAVTAGLADARAMVREQIRTLRHLISELRPLALDTLGLPAALRDLAERAADSGVLVRCDVDGLPEDTDATAAASVYRIVQEAVTNALRHAACHEITVTVTRAGSVVRVQVRDDGIGLAPGDAPGQGRRGMVERADALGARLAWTAPEDGGTAVALDVPLARLRPAA